MTIKKALIVSMLMLVNEAGATVVTEAFLDAIRMVESYGGRKTTGDNGRARGDFHMWAGAWSDASKYRVKHKLKVYDYSYVSHAFVSRAYAKSYLLHLEGQINRSISPAKCSQHGLYLAWNLGITKFRRLGYRRSRVSPTSNDRAARVVNLTVDFTRKSR